MNTRQTESLNAEISPQGELLLPKAGELEALS